MMTGYQKTYMVITVASDIATIMAIIVVVGPYGMTGVALSRLAGWVLQNGLTVLVAKRKTGMWIHAGFVSMSGSSRLVK
jgi:hypothetical protein